MFNVLLSGAGFSTNESVQWAELPSTAYTNRNQATKKMSLIFSSDCDLIDTKTMICMADIPFMGYL